MGSTVTVARNAGAFVAPSGKIIYALFEKTYESNCVPHTPSWCAVGLGEIQHVVRQVFRIASECEGGMLRNSHGHITPENYLRSWFRELANPYLLPDVGRVLAPSENFHATVPKQHIDKVSAALEQIGRTDIADDLRNGGHIPVQLYQDAKVVLALYGSEAGILPAWHFFTHRPTWNNDDRRSELGFKPSASLGPRSDFAVPVVRSTGTEELLIEQPDGSFQCAGWAYSIVDGFVEGLWEEGLRSPKTCYQRIAAYRDAVRQAPEVALESIRIIVDQTQSIENEHHRRNLEEFVKRFPVTKTETGFEVTPTEENLYYLRLLPRNATRWILPAVEPAFALAG